MTKSLELAKVREELVGKPLLGFDTSAADVEGLHKLSHAKIGFKPVGELQDEDENV